MTASKSHPSLSFTPLSLLLSFLLFFLPPLPLLSFTSLVPVPELGLKRHLFTPVQNTTPSVIYAVPLTNKVAMYTSPAPKPTTLSVSLSVSVSEPGEEATTFIASPMNTAEQRIACAARNTV